MLLLLTLPAAAQSNRRPPRKPAPAPAMKTEPAELTCPAPLGVGVTTKVAFCEVAIGRDPASGVLVKLPPHRGPVTLRFDLHARHTYSQEDAHVYARYIASVGVLTMDNTLVSRALVMAEYRSAKDLLDRIGGGAGPGGVKAVAPIGDEKISIAIPESVEDQVSILGEKLTVERQDGTETFQQPGRLIAAISNVQIEYRPAPPKKSATSKKGGRGK
ncbi:MAG TPA: hypothetical protein VFA27_14990 [Vicinamibacterales bacterium]|nr:hypothetical protein [Vicinamibacterales bacterium]